MSDDRVRLPGISPRAYEHPADRAAMGALRAVPGAAAALQAVAGMWSDRAERLYALASAIRVGPHQYPELDRLRMDCAQTLDLGPIPDLFVARDAEATAYAIGVDRPFLVLTTGIVDSLDSAELRCVIGHETGHILSGHASLRTLLMRLMRLQNTVNWIPMGALGLRAVIAALVEWFRKAELTADRAGLLCSQDLSAATRMLVFLAGGSGKEDDVNLTEFLAQAEEYAAVDDFRDSMLKLLTVEGMSHPFAVVRAAQLRQWAESGEYRAILSGEYSRRDAEQPAASFLEDIRAAGRSYRASAAASADPLMRVFSDVGEAVSNTAGSVWRRFTDRG